MFRKFLTFTSLLLTLASQSGYAAITLDSPKAVLQRGSYNRVTLSFSLNNFAPEDLQRYEMGAATTDVGIKALTKYLNVCVFEEKGKKCGEGPNIMKARYLTNSEFDPTRQDELSNDFLVGFANGSPQFNFIENDNTGTYRNIDVFMEIIANNPSKPFTTSSVIAIHLLPGVNATSTDIREAEVEPALAVVVNDVLESLEMRPSKRTLTAVWNTDEQINLKNGSLGTPDGIIAFPIDKDRWDSVTLPLHTFNEADPGAETRQDRVCTIEEDTETTCTLNCQNAPDPYYFKVDELTAAQFEVKSAGNSGSLSLTELDNATTYAVIVQAQPDGLQRRCLIAKPSDAITLSELGGGPEPVVKDPRCFIATAAYGSPLDPHLNTLRWFRDNVLMVSRAGQKLVEIYYQLSPPLADFIAARPTLRTITRGALWLPVVIIEFWREKPSALLTLSAMCATFLLLYLRRRSLRASV